LDLGCGLDLAVFEVAVGAFEGHENYFAEERDPREEETGVALFVTVHT
jgi:hypothetical protein